MNVPNSQQPLSYVGLDPYINPPYLVSEVVPTSQTTQYPLGTRLNVNGFVYEYTAAGVWTQTASYSGSGVFATLTVTGLSTLGAITQVGTASINVTGTAATTIGNVTGKTNVVGDLSVTTGNLKIASTGKGLQIKGGAVTDFVGSSTLASGTVTIANTNILTGDRIFLERIAAGASTTLGQLSYTISNGASFTVTSLMSGTPGSTETGDISTFSYFIVRPL